MCCRPPDQSRVDLPCGKSVIVLWGGLTVLPVGYGPEFMGVSHQYWFGVPSVKMLVCTDFLSVRELFGEIICILKIYLSLTTCGLPFLIWYLYIWRIIASVISDISS